MPSMSSCSSEPVLIIGGDRGGFDPGQGQQHRTDHSGSITPSGAMDQYRTIRGRDRREDLRNPLGEQAHIGSPRSWMIEPGAALAKKACVIRVFGRCPHNGDVRHGLFVDDRMFRMAPTLGVVAKIDHARQARSPGSSPTLSRHPFRRSRTPDTTMNGAATTEEWKAAQVSRVPGSVPPREAHLVHPAIIDRPGPRACNPIGALGPHYQRQERVATSHTASGTTASLAAEQPDEQTDGKPRDQPTEGNEHRLQAPATQRSRDDCGDKQ